MMIIYLVYSQRVAFYIKPIRQQSILPGISHTNTRHGRNLIICKSSVPYLQSKGITLQTNAVKFTVNTQRFGNRTRPGSNIGFNFIHITAQQHSFNAFGRFNSPDQYCLRMPFGRCHDIQHFVNAIAQVNISNTALLEHYFGTLGTAVAISMRCPINSAIISFCFNNIIHR